MSNDPSEHQPSPYRVDPKSPRQESTDSQEKLNSEKLIGETRAFSEEELQELRSESSGDFDLCFKRFSVFQRRFSPSAMRTKTYRKSTLSKIGMGNHTNGPRRRPKILSPVFKINLSDAF